MRYVIGLSLLTGLLISCARLSEGAGKKEVVGPLGDGTHLVSTRQILRPAGQSVEYHGRPVDLVLSADGGMVFVKDNGHVTANDVGGWKIKKRTPLPEKRGCTLHGVAITGDGKRLDFT